MRLKLANEAVKQNIDPEAALAKPRLHDIMIEDADISRILNKVSPKRFKLYPPTKEMTQSMRKLKTISTVKRSQNNTSFLKKYLANTDLPSSINLTKTVSLASTIPDHYVTDSEIQVQELIQSLAKQKSKFVIKFKDISKIDELI